MAALSVPLPGHHPDHGGDAASGTSEERRFAHQMGQKNRRAEEIPGTSFSALIAAGVIMTAAILFSRAASAALRRG